MMAKVNLFRDVASTYASEKNPRWLMLAVRSRTIYLHGLRHLDRFNDIPVAEITRPMIIEFRDDMYAMSGTCRVALAVLSNILSYAHNRGLVPYNQAANMKDLPPKKDIPRWEPDEITAFLKTAPDYLRNSVLLALYTGQRRSDLVRMKWSDYNGDTIKVVQLKTRKFLEIPVHKTLKKTIEAMKLDTARVKKCPYIISNRHGHPWVADTLRNAIGIHLRSIGIYGRSVHGLRKSAASCLAEAGCTAFQIAAITGQSLKEVEHYTRQADQKRLAREAMDMWHGTYNSTD
jgi:integrase